MKEADKKIALIKRMQTELDRRTEIENKAVELISDGRHREAAELLNSLDDSIIKGITDEIERLDNKAAEKTQKGGYRVDEVHLSGKPDVPNKTIRTIASGLPRQQAKKLQLALYEKYGFGNKRAYHVVRG